MRGVWLPDNARLTAGTGIKLLHEGHETFMRLEDFVESLGAWAGTVPNTGLRTFAGNTLSVGPGPGITGGTGTKCIWGLRQYGTLIHTTCFIDLTGLNSGGTAGDIIGVNGTGAAYLGRIDTSRMGTLLTGWIDCLETPAGGDTDFDLYAATEATGVEDTAISALAEAELVNAGAFSAGSYDLLSALPANDAYLYLVNQATANATYTAGQIVLNFYGQAA